MNDEEPRTCERLIYDILRRYKVPEIIGPASTYLPEGSLAARADRVLGWLTQNNQDSALATTTAAPQEPLTLERMMQTIQDLREQYPEPVPFVEILSPTEYFRRNGFRLPLSEEALAALEPPPMLSQIKQELIYGASFVSTKDFHLPPFRAPDGEGAMPLVAAQRMIEELKALSTETSWVISSKTRHQLLRLAARQRREHRAWLRAKRQRRAHQRWHNRGQSRP